MFTLRDSVFIHAPIERCFQLSTSVAIVEQELGMKPVDGRTSGFVTAGDTVRWEGQQLGFPNFHVSLISAFDPPCFFQDRMIAGRFRSFEHDHHLDEMPEGVLLRDEVRFTLPLGPPGRLAGRTILVPHIRGLLRRRFMRLQRLAETEEWREYLTDPGNPML